MKKYITFIVIVVLMASVVIYSYYKTSIDNKKENEVSAKSDSEVEIIINKDLENSYPATPREVVDFYSRILSCYYGEKCSDAQLEKMVEQSRKLFDEELLKANPIDTYMVNLKNDISEYKQNKKTISTYVIEGSADIEYKTFQSHYYAKVDTVYYVKGKNGTERTFETYTLRKDSNGKWKILYWELTDTNEENVQ